MNNKKLQFLLYFILTYGNFYFINNVWGQIHGKSSSKSKCTEVTAKNSETDKDVQKKVKEALTNGSLKLENSTLNLHICNGDRHSVSPYKKYLFEVLITIFANALIVPILHEIYNYFKKTLSEAQNKQEVIEARLVDQQYKETANLLKTMRDLGIKPSELQKALAEKKKKSST